MSGLDIFPLFAYNQTEDITPGGIGLTQRETAVLAAAEEYIKDLFAGNADGHDTDHTLRVRRTALALAGTVGADPFVTALAALLHDADDRKLSPGTHETLANARRFMAARGVEPETAERVLAVIRQVSFRGTGSVTPDTPEGMCVQDADRLDALGAIGIGRAFAYGGSRGRPLYEPGDGPRELPDERAFIGGKSSTVAHFYEKLLHLESMMNTPAGKRLANERTAFMRAFLDRFLAEWNGEDAGQTTKTDPPPRF